METRHRGNAIYAHQHSHHAPLTSRTTHTPFPPPLTFQTPSETMCPARHDSSHAKPTVAKATGWTCTDCKIAINNKTAWPKDKEGRGWGSNDIPRRCKKCWVARKMKLLSDVKNCTKATSDKKKSEKQLAKHCNKCGGTDHNINECYLRKKAQV